MNPHQIILFVLLPMSAGIASVLAYYRPRAQRAVGFAFLLMNCALACWTLAHVCAGPDAVSRILVSQMGNWPAPFGITIAVDPLSAMMLAVESIVCLAVYIYCVSQLEDRFSGGMFYPLFHLLMMGVQWSFITGDVFNLFVAFEIMLMASYAMFVMGKTTPQIKQAYKYILLNLIGSTLFVTCAGLLYGQLGTLNMADITRIAVSGQLPPTSIPVITMLVLVFGGKAAIFPLWYWLPDTYHTMPAAVGGLFAGLLTKVGAYVMIRVFVMMFGQGFTTEGVSVASVLVPILAVSAGVTMFLGVLGAVSMHTVRRILSIHIISQVGYMVMGVTLGMTAVSQLSHMTDHAILESKELAVAGAIFFIIHNMVVKCCLFLCGGLMIEHAGSDNLEKIGGLLKRTPWLATLFLIAALSLAGLPPLSGFFGKWVLIKEGFNQQWYVLTGFGLATSLLTLLSMLKIWSYGFWSPAEGKHAQTPATEVEAHHRPRTTGGMLAVGILVAMALSMGVGAQRYLDISVLAAKSLVSPQAYVQAVLGEHAVVARQPGRPHAAPAHGGTFADAAGRVIEGQVGYSGAGGVTP